MDGRRTSCTHQRGLLEDLRLELRAEDVRLREAAARLHEGESALASERHRLEEDLQMLRDQEANLRTYELRLRNQPVEPEGAAPRLSRATSATRPSTRRGPRSTAPWTCSRPSAATSPTRNWR